MMLALRDGRKFDFLNIRPEDFRIEDIAHALSNICRFGGHCPEFYSVAQHCVMIATLASELGYDRRTQRTALMHDASEAYLGDVLKPIKSNIPFYGDMEHKMMLALADRFDFNWPLPETVSTMDHDMLETEMLALWRGHDLTWRPTYGVPMKIEIVPWGAARARSIFLAAWRELA